MGAMVGSMIGYTLSATLYNTLVSSMKEAQVAHEERIRIEKECAEAIEMIKQYRVEMDAIVRKYFNHYQMVFEDAFGQMDEAFLSENIDQFICGANRISVALGGQPQFSSMEQFDSFMNSHECLNL